MADVVIRKYRPQDRDAVRRIALETAMMGEPASRFFDGEEVLADFLTIYYTDCEPGSCFVAEANGQVVGYLIGSRDTRAMDRIFHQRFLWPLIWKALCQGIVLRNGRLIGRSLVFALRGGFYIPDFYPDCPATLHINLLDGFRRCGAGKALMRAYLEYLKDAGVRGVRMATMSEASGAFFATQGFERLYASTRPYFRDALGRDVPLFVYGKKIERG